MEAVNKKVIVIAVILALISSFLVYVYVRRAAQGEDNTIYTEVFVAQKDMPAKYEITQEDIRAVQISSEYVNSKAVLNMKDIVGKRLKDRVLEGEQILKDRLVSSKSNLLSFNIPEGKRAVSMNVDEQTNVANLVRPGDYVDVLVTFQLDKTEDKDNKYATLAETKILLQNLQVMAVSQDQMMEDGKLISEQPQTVTLAVTPEESEKLVFASEFGTVRLALRPVGEDGTIETDGVIRKDVTSPKALITQE